MTPQIEESLQFNFPARRRRLRAELRPTAAVCGGTHSYDETTFCAILFGLLPHPAAPPGSPVGRHLFSRYQDSLDGLS